MKFSYRRHCLSIAAATLAASAVLVAQTRAVLGGPPVAPPARPTTRAVIAAIVAFPAPSKASGAVKTGALPKAWYAATEADQARPRALAPGRCDLAPGGFVKCANGAQVTLLLGTRRQVYKLPNKWLELPSVVSSGRTGAKSPLSVGGRWRGDPLPSPSPKGRVQRRPPAPRTPTPRPSPPGGA